MLLGQLTRSKDFYNRKEARPTRFVFMQASSLRQSRHDLMFRSRRGGDRGQNLANGDRMQDDQPTWSLQDN